MLQTDKKKLFMKVVCSRILAFRESTGLDSLEFAKRAHVLPSTYYKYEKGQSEPTIGNIRSICNHQNISADYLLGFINEMKPIAEKTPIPKQKSTHERIRKIMKVHKMDGQTFLNITGLKQNVVNKLLQDDEYKASILTIRMICDTFNVSADWLLGLNDITPINILNKMKTIEHKTDTKIPDIRRITLERIQNVFEKDGIYSLKNQLRKAGITESKFKAYKAYKETLSVRDITRICMTYDVTADYIIGKTDEMKPIHNKIPRNQLASFRKAIKQLLLVNETPVKVIKMQKRLGLIIERIIMTKRTEASLEDVITLSEKFNISLDVLLGMSNDIPEKLPIKQDIVRIIRFFKPSKRLKDKTVDVMKAVDDCVNYICNNSGIKRERFYTQTNTKRFTYAVNKTINISAARQIALQTGLSLNCLTGISGCGYTFILRPIESNDEILQETILKNIHTLMTEHCMVSTYDMTRFADIPLQTLYWFEYNRKEINTEYLAKIAIACNVSLDWLVGISGTREMPHSYDCQKRVINQIQNWRISHGLEPFHRIPKKIDKSKLKVKVQKCEKLNDIPDLKIIVSERLKKAIEQSSKTVWKITTEINMNTSSIYNYICGKTLLPAAILFKICKNINVSADYILGLTNELKPISNPVDNPVFDYCASMKKAIAKSGYNTFDFSAYAGILNVSVYETLAGRREKGNTQYIYNICVAFDLSVDWFLGLSEK